jgi:hypothetical protein
MTDGTNIQHKQARESYLRKIANLKKKYPNVPSEVIKEAVELGKNPKQHFQNLKSGVTKKNILTRVGKFAGTLGSKIAFPLTVYDFLQGSPVGAESDVVPELTPAQREKQKQYIASHAHVNEYADALHAASQRKKRGGKVKKKKKKTRSKPNKIMVGYKAGGKV